MAMPASIFAHPNTNRNNMVPPQTHNQRKPNTERTTPCSENSLLKKIGTISLATIAFLGQAVAAVGLGAGAYGLVGACFLITTNPPLLILTASLAALAALAAIGLMVNAIAVPIMVSSHL